MSTKVERNYLDIVSLKDLSETDKLSNNFNVRLVNPTDFQLNKFFYKQIGKKYRWVDRLAWDENQWIKYINNSNVRTYTLQDGNNLAGYFEQIIDQKKLECEIAYFGILQDYVGKRLGGYLLSQAIKKLFVMGANRVWVHTCSLDHKHALKNYLSRGMKIYKSEIVNIN